MSGLIGIHSNSEISTLLYYGIYAIQHRGQDFIGIVTKDSDETRSIYGPGTISDNVELEDLEELKGNIGIGFVQNDSYLKSQGISQPHIFEDGSILAMDGKIQDEGFSLFQLKDALDSSDQDMVDYISNLNGAYGILYIKDQKMLAIRDPRGIKPLSLGRGDDNTFVVASETCAFDGIGSTWYKDLVPGEILSISPAGIKSLYAKPKEHALCIFEMVYTQRPDSVVEGISVYGGRYKSGEILYKEHKTKADIVIGAPDSGIVAALGYAEKSGIPYRTGLIKNRYVGRTFINPSQITRNMDIRLKLNAIKDVVAGKDLILVDDSIVRGSTMNRTIQILRDAGAKSIHVRVAAPPIDKSDNLSINVPNESELVAYNKTVDQIRDEIGCDSLYYISIEGLREAFGNKGYYERYFKGGENGDFI